MCKILKNIFIIFDVILGYLSGLDFTLTYYCCCYYYYYYYLFLIYDRVYVSLQIEIDVWSLISS